MKPRSNKELQAYFVELTSISVGWAFLEQGLTRIPKTNRELKKEIKNLKKGFKEAGLEVPEFSEDTIRTFEMFCGE